MIERPIMKNWLEFWEKTKPENCSVEQEADLQRAFYAGALVCLQEMSSDLSPGDEVTEEDLAKLEAINDDVYAFAHKVAAGFRGVQS